MYIHTVHVYNDAEFISPSLSFSYVRAEVVAGFVNTLFLLFVAFFIFAEAIEVINIIIYVCLDIICLWHA